MKNLTKITLSLMGWLFLFQITSAQTINKHSFNIGLSSGIAQMVDNETRYEANGYSNVSFNVGYFPVNDFALGLELNLSKISLDYGPYPGLGFGAFIRFYLPKNVYWHSTFEAGLGEVDGDLTSYNKFTFNVGYSVFLSKSFALEPKLFYVFHNESETDWDFSGPGIGLGIQLFPGPN